MKMSNKYLAAAVASLLAVCGFLPILHAFESDHCDTQCPVCAAIAVVVACVIPVTVCMVAWYLVAHQAHSPGLAPAPCAHCFPLHPRPPPALR